MAYETRPGELERTSKMREYFTVNLPTNVFWGLVLGGLTLGGTLVMQIREQSANQERMTKTLVRLETKMETLTTEVWQLRSENAGLKVKLEGLERQNGRH